MFPKTSILGLAMVIIAAATIITGEGVCRAQSQSVPNLSGTWELIELGGSTKAQFPSKFPKMTLAITQTASEVKIVQKSLINGKEAVQEFTYYSDGRGETNVGRVEMSPRSVPRFASVTQWQKDKLLSNFKGRLSLGTGNSTNGGGYSSTDSFDQRKDEWRLESDGKTLALRSSTVQMNSVSITGQQTASGGAFAGPQLSSGVGRSFKQKLVFRKLS